MTANEPRAQKAEQNEVRQEGFTVLAEGVAPIVDIVFVHGLQGHPRKTWTCRAPSSKGLGTIFGSRPKEDLGVYWPRDLLKEDFGKARILTFGYDSHLTGSFKSPANRCGISDHGQDLLSALEVVRREDPQRRLIFIAHSLGGLITLRRSRGAKPYLKNVYLSTYAVIFFGTPHRGSSYAQLLKVCEQAANTVMNTNKILLEELRPNSRFLRFLREEFGSMVRESEFEVYCFQEGKPLSNFKGLSHLVVDADSSCLEDGENRDFINADHRAMCRFYGASDPGYTKVKGVISRYLDNIEKMRLEESQKCLRSLCTPVMHERRDLIESAEPHTFEWIFTEPQIGFKDWLIGNERMFWVKGKPGSGKSTLLKYLSNHPETLGALKSRWSTNVATAGFYFYDQGLHRTQKSFDGLLLGILHQVLSGIPELFSVIDDIYELARNSDGWKRVELMKAFAALGRQQMVRGCICLFIDALDEYGGSPTVIARDLIRLLDMFTKDTFGIKICASSRPLPEFEAMLQDFPGFAIHEWTSDDIRQVVTQRLMEAKRGPMLLLSDTIVLGAKGVFLWVRLIIEELSPYIFDGESEDELILKLNGLPKDLETFYSLLLQRIIPAIQPKIRSVLQMILCDNNRMMPLSLAELSLAAVLSEDSTIATQQPDIHPREDLRRCRDMEKRLKSCLGGFFEILPNRFGLLEHSSWIFEPLSEVEYQFTMLTVQFSHRTAKEFILKRAYSDFFEPQIMVDNQLAGHLRLMRLYTFLARNKRGTIYLLRWKPPEKDKQYDIYDTELINDFAFHAREAEYLQYMSACNRPPVSHDVWDFPLHLRAPIDVLNQAPKDPVKSDEVSKITRLKMMEAFNRAMDIHDTSWLEGWSQGSSKEPSCFLTFGIVHGLFLWAQDIIDGFDKATINRYNPPLLYWAIRSITQTGSFTALGLCEDEIERCLHFIRYLLRKGADPNQRFEIEYIQYSPRRDQLSEGTAEVTPLHVALGMFISEPYPMVEAVASLSCICLLLEAGADAGETKYKNYWQLRKGESKERSALHYLTWPGEDEATEDGRVEIRDPYKEKEYGKLLCNTIKAFLDHGADPNAVDSAGTTAFSWIMLLCPYDIIEYALEKGALISPALLNDDGSPVKKHGILLEDRWRRPECYTPEARELVRKHMPHWEDPAEEEEPVETKSGGGGWVVKIGALIGWP